MKSLSISKKMSKQRDICLQIHALLEGGKTPTEISKQLGVTRQMVYSCKAKRTVKKKAGSGRKTKLDLQVVKDTLEAAPLKSMQSHAKDLETLEASVQSAVKKLGRKSLVRVERPILKENEGDPSPPLSDSSEQFEEGMCKLGHHLF